MNGKRKLNTEAELGSAPLMPLIAKYAIPSIVSMLVGALYNLTDQIFIGRIVGVVGNAASNVVFPTVTLSTALSMLLGIGTAANFNISQGAGKLNDAKKYVYTGLSVTAIIGLLTGLLVFLFRGAIIDLCGASPSGNVYPYAMKYLSISAIGLPFYIFASAAATTIRADGSPRYSMLFNIVGAVLNVGLDWLFMYPLGKGIEGAATATVISQIVTFVLAMLYFTRFKAFDIKIKEISISLRHMMDSIQAGVPTFINQILLMTTNIVLNNMLETYGALSNYGSDIPLAVSGVAQKTNMIMISFAVGIAQGCQPIWGYNLGAKNYQRVKGTYMRAFAIAFTIGVIFFSMLQLFPREIVSIFGTGSDLYFEFAEKYLKIYMLFVFFQNIQPVTVTYFSATDNPKQGLLVSLSRQGLFLIPLLIVLPKYMGIHGILIASPISDTLAFIISVTMVWISFKRFPTKED
ncbi:MAG: MATE family efflux transporter [Bacteroidales bacterium]|nr:MATE family efflux transporter [Bacteroidales bacterium]